MKLKDKVREVQYMGENRAKPTDQQATRSRKEVNGDKVAKSSCDQVRGGHALEIDTAKLQSISDQHKDKVKTTEKDNRKSGEAMDNPNPCNLKLARK